MQAILLSREEVARRAKQLYENGIRRKVEVEENIGKMVIIDIETGDYEVDKTGLQGLDTMLPSPLGVLWSGLTSDIWDCDKSTCNGRFNVLVAKWFNYPDRVCHRYRIHWGTVPSPRSSLTDGFDLQARYVCKFGR